jgi:hypothetical protein
VDNPAAVRTITRAHAGKTYVIAVGMTDKPVSVRFRLEGATGKQTILGEQRAVNMEGNGWTDSFNGYDAHVYVLSQEN